MFCLKCGREIADDAVNCPYCGSATENATAPMNMGMVEDPSVKKAKTFGIIGVILGSLGVFWAWVIAIFGWMLGGAGLALALIGFSKNKDSKICMTGVILSGITLVFSLINSVAGFVLAL